MLPAILALSVSFADPPRVPLDPIKGSERLSIALPPKFVSARRTRGHLVLASKDAEIMVDWTPDMFDAKGLQAVNRSMGDYRKKGQIAGSLTLGPYSGFVVHVPMNHGRIGLDLHAPLISGRNLLAITYYAPKADVKAASEAQKLLVWIAANSKFFRV